MHLRNSNAIGWLALSRRSYRWENASTTILPRDVSAHSHSPSAASLRRQRSLIANSSIFAVLLVAAIFAAFHAVLLLRQVHGAEIVELLKGASPPSCA